MAISLRKADAKRGGTRLSSRIDEYAAAFQLCLYCPSLCRHVCPVATADGSDSTSPWALMSLADHLRTQRLEVTAETVKALSSCAGCGACQAACLHDNPVSEALTEVRTAAVEAGLGPVPASALARPPLPMDHPLFDALRARSRFEERPVFSLVPGTATLLEAPEVVQSLIGVCERLEIDLLSCGDLARHDPGYDLWFAGHQREFVAQARAAHEATRGAQDIVVMSAETLYLLKHVYPRYGLSIDAELVHVSEFLLPILSGAVVKRRPGRVVYYESCILSRKLGLRDVPRQVLRRVLAEPIIEMPARPEVTGCCGGSGIGIACPETAERMADAVVEAILGMGGAERPDLVVSFSPECVTALRGAIARQGARAAHLEIEHAVALVAEAVVRDGAVA